MLTVLLTLAVLVSVVGGVVALVLVLGCALARQLDRTTKGRAGGASAAEKGREA